ncbi:hypothetical protein [Pseudonocardia sp. KRD291]|uniref:hypothetical protein n=1 Tax=Pseudonocardia sp. KRD291 TaxID=2792007 RepID=UPI001C4A34EE|nr:hypothetical protein [Pseudonocardia sp. KRD291]MBW0105873.1 hypothetical protein [Pseudonocardia sp. KRD291]
MWPPYRERVIGDTVLATSDFGRRPDGEYGTGPVVGFEHYTDGAAGALVRLDHDPDHVDWFPLTELRLTHPAPATPTRDPRAGPRSRRGSPR